MTYRLFLFTVVVAMSQTGESQETYRLPPQEVVDIIDAPVEPAVRLSPDRSRLLMVYRDAMPSIADVARRMLRLAGRRIDPAANSPFQTSFNTGFGIRGLNNRELHDVPLPEGAKLGLVRWSHDSKSIALSS